MPNNKPENTFTDYNKIKRAARTVNVGEIEISSNVNKATDLLIKKILYCIDCSKTSKKSRFKKRQEWITAANVNLCRTKEKLQKEWKSNQTNGKKEKKFKKFSNKLGKILTAAKNKYELNKVKVTIIKNCGTTQAPGSIINLRKLKR